MSTKPPWSDWEYKRTRERINIIVDSGASTCILPKSIAKDHPVYPRTTDRTYTAATKEEVCPDGMRYLTVGVAVDGADYKSEWEVADVHRPLYAVSKLLKKRKRVIFDSEEDGGSWIFDKTDDRWMKLYEADGVYVLPVLIKPNEESEGFHRRAKL